SELPKSVMLAIAATARSPAISPYSIAVAPRSSAAKGLVMEAMAPTCWHLLEKIAQGRDQWLVRGRHGKPPQRLRPDPLEGRMLQCAGRALPPSAHVKWHQQVKAFIRMADKTERGEAGRLRFDRQFLAQFADQRRLRRLPR